MITIGKRIYMKAKKMVKILLGILIVVGIIFGYVQYKFYTVEHTVIKYLTAEEQSRKNPLHRNRLWQICQVKKIGRFQ